MNKTNIKKIIKERGFTQETLAEKIGISHSAIKSYISGRVSPPVHIVLDMSEALGCSIEYLIDDSKPPYLEHSYNDVYTLIKDMGFDVSYNPDNEDQIEINTIGLTTRTTIDELTTKIKEFIQFEIYRSSKEVSE